jgi:hypothetical protein
MDMSMNLLASGYFYDVYDVGNDRVLKKQRAFKDIAKSIQGKNQINFFVLMIKTFVYIKKVKQNTNVVRRKLSVVPRELLGNPEFVNSTDYTQDKVVLLMDYFDTHTLDENKIVVLSYTELIKKLLKYGIHDYVYKFKNSYGLNKKGGVVFIDFNEVTFSKEETLTYIKNSQCKSEAQFRKFPEGELKEYIGYRLSNLLKPDLVNQYWIN